MSARKPRGRLVRNLDQDDDLSEIRCHMSVSPQEKNSRFMMVGPDGKTSGQKNIEDMFKNNASTKGQKKGKKHEEKKQEENLIFATTDLQEKAEDEEALQNPWADFPQYQDAPIMQTTSVETVINGGQNTYKTAPQPSSIIEEEEQPETPKKIQRDFAIQKKPKPVLEVAPVISQQPQQISQPSSSVIIQQQDGKPLRGKEYVIDKLSLKNYQVNQIRDILQHLGGKILMPQFARNTKNLNLIVSPETQARAQKEYPKCQEFIFESEFDQYVQKMSGFSIEQIENQISSLVNVNGSKAKVQVAQKVDQTFFNQSMRQIQETEVIVDVIKMQNQLSATKSDKNNNVFIDPEKTKPIKITPKPQVNNAQVQHKLQQQVPSNKGESWTEKYKPQSLNDCISNEAPMRELAKWLQGWGTQQDQKVSQKGFRSQFISAKAVLLSGPPGIGKTTSARVVTRQLGYQILEWNASDVRSQKSIMEEAGHLTSNTTIQLTKNKKEFDMNKRTVILMDEVDGMTGNDRGGIRALIDLIKTTQIPIICICNDRHSKKIKSLLNYCLDLQFKKPDEKKVQKMLEDICQKEGISFSKDILTKQIQESQCDIRQLINTLQFNGKLNQDKLIMSKDQSGMINIFDATKYLLDYNPKVKVSESLNMFFIDYTLIPLMYQENYINNSRSIEDIAAAADSIAISDIFAKRIRKQQDWSLLGQQGFMATVYPTSKIKQPYRRKVEFTQHYGKMSSIKKYERILQELKECFSTVNYNLSTRSIQHKFNQVVLRLIARMIQDGEHDEAAMTIRSFNLNMVQFQGSLMDAQVGFPKQNFYKALPPQDKTKLTVAYKHCADSAELGAKKKKVKVRRDDQVEENKDDFDEFESEPIDDQGDEIQDNIDDDELEVVEKKQAKPKKGKKKQK